MYNFTIKDLKHRLENGSFMVSFNDYNDYLEFVKYCYTLNVSWSTYSIGNKMVELHYVIDMCERLYKGLGDNKVTVRYAPTFTNSIGRIVLSRDYTSNNIEPHKIVRGNKPKFLRNLE